MSTSNERDYYHPIWADHWHRGLAVLRCPGSEEKLFRYGLGWGDGPGEGFGVGVTVRVGLGVKVGVGGTAFTAGPAPGVCSKRICPGTTG